MIKKWDQFNEAGLTLDSSTLDGWRKNPPNENTSYLIYLSTEILESVKSRYNDALDKAVKMGKTKRLVIKDFDPMHPSKGTIEYLSE